MQLVLLPAVDITEFQLEVFRLKLLYMVLIIRWLSSDYKDWQSAAVYKTE